MGGKGSGGARSRSGSPPDPNALRRDRADDKGWVELPSTGRGGDPPRFPLSRPTQRELAIWAREWARPQAIMWSQLGLELEVAMYVRAVRRAESPKAPVALFSQVRQSMESLGITEAGLARKRWRIVDEAAPPVSTESDGDVRARLKLVQGGKES